MPGKKASYHKAPQQSRTKVVTRKWHSECGGLWSARESRGSILSPGPLVTIPAAINRKTYKNFKSRGIDKQISDN